MRSFHKLHRDESGMSFVFVGFGLMGFLAASMLAIDVGMLMTARSQAQISADAGALAGALALSQDDWDDRTATGPAVTNAIAAAKANNVMGGTVSVTPENVEFLNDEMGQPNRVRVTVYRRATDDPDTTNAVPTMVAKYFGVGTADIGATATAEVSPANAMTCVKPFTIPDKWIENGSPPWDGDDTYDAFTNQGVRLPNADVYIPATEPNYSGYNNERERGQRLVIRAATGQNITVSFYFSLAIGGMEGTGGEVYRWNIANCNTSIMRWGDMLIQEPGAMDGPTTQGIADLIARDLNAYWDTSTNTVKGSAFGNTQSPRIFPIPLYDPEFYDSGKRNGRMADLRVANWIGFFAEEALGNGIYGRIIPIGGIRDKYANSPEGLFPKAIRLVK